MAEIGHLSHYLEIRITGKSHTIMGSHQIHGLELQNRGGYDKTIADRTKEKIVSLIIKNISTRNTSKNLNMNGPGEALSSSSNRNQSFYEGTNLVAKFSGVGVS